MNFLKQIFTEESTAYIGLCKFKTAKVNTSSCCNNVKFNTTARNFYATDFSKNILL